MDRGLPAHPVVIVYPNLRAAVAGLELDELARRAGVPLAELEQLVAGGWAAAPVTEVHLARALDTDLEELFAPAHLIGGRLIPIARADVEPVTDTATLRALSRR